MVAAYVQSSKKGNDTFLNSCVVPVPTGAAAGHVVVLGITVWDDTAGTVVITPPTGFVNISAATLPRNGSGGQKFWTYYKILNAADTGNYTFGIGSSEWNTGQAVLISGADIVNPVDAANTGYTAGYSTPPSISITATVADLLVHFLSRENSGTSTPATGYTEVQEANVLTTGYKVGSGAGTETASGGTSSVTTNGMSTLVGIKASPYLQAAVERGSSSAGTYGNWAFTITPTANVTIYKFSFTARQARTYTLDVNGTGVGNVVTTGADELAVITFTAPYVAASGVPLLFTITASSAASIYFRTAAGTSIAAYGNGASSVTWGNLQAPPSGLASNFHHGILELLPTPPSAAPKNVRVYNRNLARSFNW